MAPSPPDGPSEVFDFNSFFERTGGDEGLAKELISLVLRDLPTLFSAIREAANAHDATKLERSAHALKGAVANFSAALSVKAAEQLEIMGRQGNFENVEQKCDVLQNEVERLREALTRAQASN